MDVGAVMDELGTALGTIDGLRVYPYWADKISSPAAVVAFPEAIEFDSTYNRGADTTTLDVLVLVARRDGRTTRDRLGKYAAGDGDDSVKAAIEGHTATAYDSARVQRADFGVSSVAGTEYLAATFTVEIIGQGA